MKKTEVYEKKYKIKQVNEYYDLISNIRKESLDESNGRDNTTLANGWGEIGYIRFDGDFLVRVSKHHLNKYNKSMNTAKITIEKIGPDVNKESQIEKMLLEKGFKRVEEK